MRYTLPETTIGLRASDNDCSGERVAIGYDHSRDGDSGHRAPTWDLSPANQLPPMEFWPSIDVVVPTFNCETNIRRCLQEIRNQTYEGKIEIIVVDGGSTDATTEVARNLGARIHVNPGQYGTGLTGARHFGERLGTSDLVWCIDSDNFVIGQRSTQSLATPFIETKNIVFTIPVVATNPEASQFCNWLALDEIEEIRKVIGSSKPVNEYWVTEDMTYGLSNACMIRRDALMAAGGYDSDVRLLRRLRECHLSKAAIMPQVRFHHDQTSGVMDYRRKWLRRLIRLASLADTDLAAYFRLENSNSRGSRIKDNVELRRVKRGVIDAPINFSKTGDVTWLAGLAYLPVLASVVALHPIATKKLLGKIL